MTPPAPGQAGGYRLWDEKPYSEGHDLPKLTRASVTKTFTGDIEGEGQVEYLMMYPACTTRRGMMGPVAVR